MKSKKRIVAVAFAAQLALSGCYLTGTAILPAEQRADVPTLAGAYQATLAVASRPEMAFLADGRFVVERVDVGVYRVTSAFAADTPVSEAFPWAYQVAVAAGLPCDVVVEGAFELCGKDVESICAAAEPKPDARAACERWLEVLRGAAPEPPLTPVDAAAGVAYATMRRDPPLADDFTIVTRLAFADPETGAYWAIAQMTEQRGLGVLTLPYRFRGFGPRDLAVLRVTPQGVDVVHSTICLGHDKELEDLGANRYLHVDWADAAMIEALATDCVARLRAGAAGEDAGFAAVFADEPAFIRAP